MSQVYKASDIQFDSPLPSTTPAQSYSASQIQFDDAGNNAAASQQPAQNGPSGYAADSGNAPNPVIGQYAGQLADATARALPLAGMASGVAASLPFAAAAGPLAPVVPVLGAIVGGIGGRGYQQVYNAATGKGVMPSVGAAAQDLADAGANAANSQMMGQIASPIIAKALVGGTLSAPNVGQTEMNLKPGETLGGAAGAVRNTAVRFGANIAKIPETISRYVLNRGTGNVLTSENMTPDATVNALESAQNFLARNNRGAALSVAATEDSLPAGELDKPLDTTGLASNLRAWMSSKGLLPGSPERALAAGGSDLTKLDTAQGLLDQGTLTGRQLINTRRLLDDVTDFNNSPLAPRSGITSTGIENLANGMRGQINETFPSVGETNAKVSGIFDITDKYRKLLNVPDTGSEAGNAIDAVRRVRGLLSKAPAAPAEMTADFGAVDSQAGPPVAQHLFDTIAAQHFTPESPTLVSPSSPILKALSTIGLTGGDIAGYGLSAAQHTSGLLSGVAGATPMTPLAVQALQNHMSQSSLHAYYMSQFK